MKHTRYLLVQTQDEYSVIATDYMLRYDCPVNSDGIDINSGVDLYQYDEDGRWQKELIVNQLKTAYRNIYDDLYNMSDIQRDFPDKVNHNISADVVAVIIDVE